MIACKIMSLKPSRLSMKFETFDHKFQIQFMNKAIFQDAIGLFKSFYAYRLEIKDDHDDSMNISQCLSKS